jgi:hypothetical protein
MEKKKVFYGATFFDPPQKRDLARFPQSQGLRGKR